MKKYRIFLIIFSLIVSLTCVSGNDLVLQRCIPKADMTNIAIRCSPKEMIVVKEAFFTSSVSEQCPFWRANRSTTESNVITAHGKSKLSCTDDLRISLNARCSGRSNCVVNLRKIHAHRCDGFDGWMNIRYSCVTSRRLHSYCNIMLEDNYGYVTNPGYPNFYPPYNCKWKLRTSPGQKIQVEIFDFSLKEPRFTSKKLLPYECSDHLSIVEDNAKVITLCGESKSNLIDYRSKGTELIVELTSYDFSPTRGVLFKYSMLNCPTLMAPSNGYMYRNASYAYYHCNFDYVFEDTGLPIQILLCEYDTYWNGTVARCLPKENVTMQAYALTNQNDQPPGAESSWTVQPTPLDGMKSLEYINDHLFTKGFLAPLVLVISVLVVTLVVIVAICKLRSHSVEKTSV